MKRAALILAGGKSQRFQSKRREWRDKALSHLSGKPLLVHVVQNANEVVDEVVVCVNDETRKTRYSEILREHNLENVKLAVDEEIYEISGPNIAIITGLKETTADFCITLPCDMPLIKSEVIKYLLDIQGDSQIAVPMWPNGRLETLVMVLERKSAAEITETLCFLKRPRSDDIIRGAASVLFVSPVGEIRILDPELKSFVNINRDEDLTKLRTRLTHGKTIESAKVNLGAPPVPELPRLREASKSGSKNKFVEALDLFSSCATEFEKQGSPFWGGLSREKEGEMLLAWSRLQNEVKEADELDSRAKDAFFAAANNYGLEAKVHSKAGRRFLAKRAWADRAWCESWAIRKAGNGDRYASNHGKA
jgi:molybdopterin-guanine dinucleotide biosynthesis protein A